MARKKLLHLRSSVVEGQGVNSAPKLPTPEQIEIGEIAINFAKGYETLSIKNASGEVVTFTNDEYWVEKERVVAAALNDLDERKADASAVTSVETIVTAHTANTTIHVTAEDKEFTVPKGNETLEVEMLDNKTKVSLIKLDMKSGKPLAGSHLQVLDKDNNILFEFVSTEEKVVLEGLLEVGETYHLHEAKAPNLYQRNVDVEFKVEDTDEEIEVEISDDKTLLSIEKTDEKGNKISGALLQIIDSKGNVIKEFTSSEKAEELYGVLNELEIYTLHEEKAPEGYLKAEDIKFKIDEEGKVNIYEGEEFKQQKENVIKMVDKKFENPKTTYKKIIVVFLLMMIVLTAIRIINKKTV